MRHLRYAARILTLPWYDAMREPWRFLLFISVIGILVASGTALGLGIVVLLGECRALRLLKVV